MAVDSAGNLALLYSFSTTINNTSERMCYIFCSHRGLMFTSRSDALHKWQSIQQRQHCVPETTPHKQKIIQK